MTVFLATELVPVPDPGSDHHIRRASILGPRCFTCELPGCVCARNIEGDAMALPVACDFSRLGQITAGLIPAPGFDGALGHLRQAVKAASFCRASLWLLVGSTTGAQAEGKRISVKSTPQSSFKLQSLASQSHHFSCFCSSLSTHVPVPRHTILHRSQHPQTNSPCALLHNNRQHGERTNPGRRASEEAQGDHRGIW